MASQSLSSPTLFTSSDLQSHPALVTRITNLINDAFTRSKLSDPEKWGKTPRKRFLNNDQYFEMLSPTGIVAVIFDRSSGVTEGQESNSDSTTGKVVAVAAVVPWQGGWLKEGAGVEEGWEVKAVAVDGDAKYLRKGLFIRLSAALEERLMKQSLLEDAKRTRLTLWILLAECINGVYWRKRGYHEVRRAVCGEGTWGCLTCFEMVVLKKDVEIRSRDDIGGLVQP
jgi:hypothetical protein